MRASYVMWWRVSAVLIGASILWACTKPNPDFCDEDGDCKNGEVCNLDVNRCVAAPPDTTCATDDECPAERPICEDTACRSCITDSECGTDVCRVDGTCEATQRVLYVRPNGVTSGTCTQVDRCDLTYARTLLSSDRDTIHLADGTYNLPSAIVYQNAAHATFVGSRAAIVQSAAAGAIFESSGVGTKLVLRGFTLHQGVACANASLDVTSIAFNNPPNDVRPWIAGTSCSLVVTDSALLDSRATGIELVGGGLLITGSNIERSAGDGVRGTVSATIAVKTSTITKSNLIGITADSGSVLVQRSIVSYNRLGGIRSTGGTFDITNNFVFRNGDPGASAFGGMHLDSASNTSRVQHNTVMRNDSDVNVTPVLSGGLFCRIGTLGLSYNNLIANNYRGNTSLPNAQTGGSCDFTYSLVAESDVSFGCVPANEICHLSGGAGAARDAGQNLGVTEDFDGEPRSDGKPDVGADEYHP